MIRSPSSGSSRDYSLESPSIWRNRLGRELRRLREERGLLLADVASELQIAASTMSRIERGLAPLKLGYLTIMFTLYGVSNSEQRKLLDMARKGQSKGWWHKYSDLLQIEACSYLGLEAAATALCSFSPLTIPGLLQTEQYAAAVLTATRPDMDARQLQDLIRIQMRRQEVLSRSGCQLDLLIDESALMRTVGSGQIMARQADHMAEIAAQPQVTVRLVSLQAVHPVLTFPYTVLTFDDPDDQPVGCHQGACNQITLSTDQAQVKAALRLHAAMAREAVPLLAVPCQV